MVVHDTSNGATGREVAIAHLRAEMVERARDLSGLRGSAGGKVAAATGAVAEVAVEEWFRAAGVQALRSPAIRSDLWLPVSNLRLDVKAKLRAAPPEPHHAVAVAAQQMDAPPDWYVFTSLVAKPDWRVWVVGAVESARLKAEGRYWEKGERDDANGTVMWGACWTMEIRQIAPPEEALRRFAESGW